MQLALNTITFEPKRWMPDKSHARPIEEALQCVSRAGYDATEIWQHHLTNRPSADVPGIAELLRSLGIKTAAVGGYPLLHLSGADRQEEMDRIKRVMDDCCTLGSPLLKIFTGRVASDDITPEQRGLSMAFLRELLDEAASRGLTVTSETHGRTLTDNVSAAESVLSELGADNFKICFQPFDLADTERAVRDFDSLAAHVAHVHLQARDDNGFCLMKDAPMDFRAFVGHLKKSGFDGLLSVEFVKGCSPRDSADYSDEETVASAIADRELVLEAWNA